MNNILGFYITKLCVVGANVKPAKIEFDKGFNVISGLSDTGKSYIFSCLNFMLGGGDTPKAIPESEGYSEAFLEIKTYSGISYTLNRELKGGKFKLKEVEIENFSTHGVVRILKNKHSNSDDENISTFLLSLSGFRKAFVKKDAQNSKRELSFRDIAKLTHIDEERIITEKSPVYSGQHPLKIQEQSIFEIILTGNDASSLQQLEDSKVSSNIVKGKLEFVEGVIADLSKKLEKIESKSPIHKKGELQKKVDDLSQILSDSSILLEELSKQKQKLFNQINEVESKNLLQSELINRFSLLNEHYISDIKRLEFITEGESLFAQLQSIKCPICGGDLNKEHYDCIIEKNEENSSIVKSIEVELNKIKLKLVELEKTLIQLKDEKLENELNLEILKKQYKDLSADIQEKIEPVKASTKTEINNLILELSYFNERDILLKQLEGYLFQKHLLDNEAKRKPKQEGQEDSTKFFVFKEFCKAVESLLEEWKYPNLLSVNFNHSYSIYDIRINNQERKSHGKGIRAITYASFIIGLMDYCINKKLPHSRNIIIDSPLTTYQGKESKNIEITKDMEDAFFSELSLTALDKQIIILDNKAPNQNIISKINYIHFSGDSLNGRKGFFPITE